MMQSDGPRLDGVRVLIVEDNPDNVVLATALLRRAGADVDVAWNGAEAVERVLRGDEQPQMVLMDLMMPVMDGWTATKHFRRHGYAGTIVALSALSGPDNRRACLDGGFDDFLAKPYEPDALLTLLADVSAPREVAARSTARGVSDELFARLEGGYVERLRLTAKRLRDALSRADTGRLSHLVLTIAGSAATYGQPRVSELAAAARDALETSGDTGPVEALLDEIDRVVAARRGAAARS